MKFKKYLLLFLLIPLFAFTLHKYYISLCEIEYNQEKKSLQIIVGIFIDDLEFTLNKDHKTTLNLATKQEIENIDEYYLNYLNEHFKISLNNESKVYEYIGKEYDNDIVHFYLEIPNINELKSIEVTNTSLFRNFENQQNIIKIKANNKNKTFYLTPNNVKGFLNY
ncbi:DUF6702 family protein [Lutibacter sp.]|uniref:DUF6702 family protein n=1 Tax=Lutibacter sp. TaxID=1925666 RepID=UPI0035612E69